MAIAGSVLAVVSLTWLSTGSQGPIATFLTRLGAAAGVIEHSARTRLSGPGRMGDLAWFDRYRRDPALLRRPDSVLLGAYDGGIPRTLEGVAVLERRLEATLPLIQVYTAWGDRPDQQFPLQLVSAIRDFGSVAMV